MAGPDQPRRFTSLTRLLRCAGKRDAAFLPQRNPRLAGGLESLSRRSVQLLPLPPLGRIQQAGLLWFERAGGAPKTRCLAVALAKNLRRPLFDRASSGIATVLFKQFFGDLNGVERGALE